MEHAAVDQRRRVLEADQRGELAGLVELPGDLLNLLPRALGQLLAVDALLVADVEPRWRPLRQTERKPVERSPCLRCGCLRRTPTNTAGAPVGRRRSRDLEPFGVVGHRGEVERSAQLLGGAPEEGHRLAARELVGIAGREPVAEHVAVDRVRSMDVEVAEIGVALRIARNRRLGRLRLRRRPPFRPLLLGAAREREHHGQRRLHRMNRVKDPPWGPAGARSLARIGAGRCHRPQAIRSSPRRARRARPRRRNRWRRRGRVAPSGAGAAPPAGGQPARRRAGRARPRRRRPVPSSTPTLKRNSASGMSPGGSPTSDSAPAKPRPCSRPNAKDTSQGAAR